MGSVVKFLKETYRKQTLWEAVKSGGWRAALDGTVAETTLIHGPTGTFVGEDELGNRYYENKDNQAGRHRWVVYKDLSWPTGQEATSVAPDWHGWLHSLYDVPPSQKDFKRPIYSLKHTPNKSGQTERYLPKGSWFNPKKRNWTKVQFWQPPKTDGIVPPNA
ncbi:hypothetical protein ABBQ32_010290 [Trebouxia sp. C0010 RCD-2024]